MQIPCVFTDENLEKNVEDFIPVNEPFLAGNESKYLNECISTNWISSSGKFISSFEEQISKHTSRTHAIAVSSGTAALELALKVLDLKSGDEVIVPSFTIICCINAILKAGATPVLVDCDIETFNTSINHIEEKITERTKAILLPHIFCFPIDLEPILRLAKNRDIKVIEDAAQMIGQDYNDRPCGSFGDISIFSFYANKLITTGEGGMLVTDNEQYASRLRRLKDQAFMPGRRFLHDEIGSNFRMTNMQAAVGVAQFEQLNDFIERKRTIGRIYNEILQGHDKFSIAPSETSYAKNIYWAYPVVLKSDLNTTNEDIMREMGAKGIGTRPFFWPMHEQPIFKELNLFKDDCHKNTEFLARKGLYLPSSLSLTRDQITRSAETLLKILDKY